MPGSEYSGRRTLEKPDLDIDMPDMGETEESVRTFIRWCANALMRHIIDPRYAAELTSMAGVQLRALKQEESKSEIKRLEKLLRDAEDVKRSGEERASLERQHRK